MFGPEFAVEEGGDLPGYHKVHRAGCRDLIDAEPIGAAHDWVSLFGIVHYVYGDEYPDIESVKMMSAPCVVSALHSARK